MWPICTTWLDNHHESMKTQIDNIVRNI